MIRVRGLGAGRRYNEILSPVGPQGGFGNFEWSAYGLPAPLEPLAADLLRIGCAVHLADRLIRRSASITRNLRRLEVRVGVAEPAKWRRVAPLLEELAEFATGGDRWHLSFARARQDSNYSGVQTRVHNATTVALFSGGLDSLCGAAELAQREHARPIFVTHSPPGRAATQNLLGRVFAAFGRELPQATNVGYRLELREIGRTGARSLFQEASRRSRPFFYLSLACAAAIAHRVPRIQMSENGALALSLPHRYDAFGPSIARQAHTFLLAGFETLLDELVPKVSWVVTNPFVNRTKGEACFELNSASRLARDSVSCEYLGRQRARVLGWKRLNARRARSLGQGPQCGLCIPCIVRRAALKRARIRDPDNEYFAHAPEVLSRIEKRKSTQQVYGGSIPPPLLGMLVPNVLYMERHCQWLAEASLTEYAERFIPELRANRQLSATPMMDVSACHALSRRYAQEILAFFHE